MIGDYRPASFAGAQFYVSQTRDDFGRRGAHHEFPYGDRGLWDDLGGKDGRRQIEAFTTDFCPGGFAVARDRLIAALQKGAGELAHPWLGRHQVVCTDFSVTHSDKELGVCRLSLTFIDADVSAANPTANPVAGLLAGCDGALSALTRLFTNGFSVDGVVAFASEVSYGRLDDLLAVVNQGLSTYREVESALSPFIDAALGWFGDVRGHNFNLPVYGTDKVEQVAAGRLSMTPAELAQNVIGLTTLLIPAAGTAGEAYNRLTTVWDAAVQGDLYQAPPKAASAASVAAINRNYRALYFLFLGAAAVESARLTPWMAFEHQDQGAQVQADILARFDVLAERLADYDAGHDADQYYQALQTIIANALEVIAQAAPNLALLGHKTLADTWPSVRVCYDLYGDLAREADLVARNRVAHPGFVPGGSALEYLIDV